MSTGWRASFATTCRTIRPSAPISISCPRPSICPPSHRKKWLYYKLFPNVAFDIYPDQVDFMQFLPVSATETVIREVSYALPDDAARDEGGALSQLADQPAGQRRGQRADRAGAGRGWRARPMSPGRWGRAKCACAASRRNCGGLFPRRGWSGRRRQAGRARTEAARQPADRQAGEREAEPHRVASSPAPKNIAMRVEQADERDNRQAAHRLAASARRRRTSRTGQGSRRSKPGR